MGPFRFDFAKALQAAAFILRSDRYRRMNYMRLLKVLYIAERESLQETGKPITGSHVVAMERGPVLEEVFSLIRGQHLSTPEWSTFIRRDEYNLELLDDPGVGRLSKYVTSKLDEVLNRHHDHDEWDMVNITHLLPEWQKNNPGKSSRHIPFEDVVEAVGRIDDLQQIIDSATRDTNMDKLFSEPQSA